MSWKILPAGIKSELGCEFRLGLQPGNTAEAKVLFGAAEQIEEAGEKKQISNAGCVQIMEATILAFPVRSLAGCFAWLTCPAALERFKRDTGRKFDIPTVDKDRVVAGAELVVSKQVVLEEYALDQQSGPNGKLDSLTSALQGIVSDALWQDKLIARLALVHDDQLEQLKAEVPLLEKPENQAQREELKKLLERQRPRVALFAPGSLAARTRPPAPLRFTRHRPSRNLQPRPALNLGS